MIFNLYCYCLGLCTCLLISCSPFLLHSLGFSFLFPNFYSLYLEEENLFFQQKSISGKFFSFLLLFFSDNLAGYKIESGQLLFPQLFEAYFIVSYLL